jgi:hypothetical protein
MTTLFAQLNQLFDAAVLIVSFSLLAYIALQNLRNSIARSLCVLLFCVIVVYSGDVLAVRASNPNTRDFLARAQWLGIALVPAAYLHLAHALTSADLSKHVLRRRRMLVVGSYLGSALVFFLVARRSELVVAGSVDGGLIAQFAAGPLFPVYVLGFVLAAIVTLFAILKAHREALTPTMRRRFAYLGLSFVAPGLGVFPYLVIAGTDTLSPGAVLALASVVSGVVAVLITVMTYSVAFHGVLLPDRLIKQDFIRWWLYGPFVGVMIILCIMATPTLEALLGLPSDTLLTFGVMIMTVVMPLFISRVKPYLDALVYRQDHTEIAYLRNLPRSTFTRTDLRQLLENSLIAICGALRVETGFVIGVGDESYTVRASCGSRSQVKRFVNDYPLSDLLPRIERLATPNAAIAFADQVIVVDGFCLLPLRSPDGIFLGALAVACTPQQFEAAGHHDPAVRRLISVLAHQMEMAISMVQLQQRIFDSLRSLGPEMQSLQQLSTKLEQATPGSLQSLEQGLTDSPEFTQLVKDALTQFWGGPKLAESPLLSLRTVRRMLNEQGGSSTRALQAVLRQAISNLRPDEQLDPSAQEWLLYNLLEGRFLQRKTVRDVANRLAMSESDFYRKQRVAVEEVARQLALMERGEHESVAGRG